MTDCTFVRAATLALCSVAACADVDTVEDEVRTAYDQEPGAIDGGVASGTAADAYEVDSRGSVDAGRAEADAGLTLRPAQGAYFADIRANGTGCPAGSWSTSISRDGQIFSTRFASFYVEVERTRAISVADCNIAFTIHSPEPLSYTVEDFYFGGWMYLEQDVQFRARSSVFFQGSPDQRSDWASDVVGPQEGSFRVQTASEPGAPVRSRCGTEQTLHTRLDARLLNSNPRRNGFVNITLPSEAYASFKLTWRRCND